MENENLLKNSMDDIVFVKGNDKRNVIFPVGGEFSQDHTDDKGVHT